MSGAEQLGPSFHEVLARRLAAREPIAKSITKSRPWTIGFGPVLFKAGETRRIDAQPKCLFTVEKILANYHGLVDAHLLGLYIGREEILGLGGDSIDLGRVKEIVVKKSHCQPALPIIVEIANRSSEDQMIALSIVGVAHL